jgi:hypothetical protein
MDSTNWLKALDAASAPREILAIVEDFIASRSDVYWAGVPEALRQPAIDSEEALGRWHHDLVRAITEIASPGTPMQELCVFSLRASVRLHQVHLRQSTGRPSNEGEIKAAPARKSH